MTTGDFYIYKVEADGTKRYLATITVNVDNLYTDSQQTRRLNKFASDKTLAMPLTSRHQANALIGIFFDELKDCKVGNINQ